MQSIRSLLQVMSRSNSVNAVPTYMALWESEPPIQGRSYSRASPRALTFALTSSQVFVTIIAGTVAPKSAELIGFLMFGNLIRECGVLDSLSQSAQHELANLITLLLGLSVSFRMQAEAFLTWQTLLILALGLVGFVFDTVGGVFFAKFLNLFSKKKINPLIGATGLSAVPMASRVCNGISTKYDPKNHVLNYCMASNIAGVIGSAVAAGVLISFLC